MTKPDLAALATLEAVRLGVTEHPGYSPWFVETWMLKRPRTTPAWMLVHPKVTA